MRARQFITVQGHRLDITGLSAANARALVLGVRGADGDEAPTDLDLILERVTSENLVTLSDEDLAEVRADLLGRIEAMPAAPADWTDEHLADARRIQAGIDLIRADEGRRDTEAEARATEATQLLASLRGETGDDGEGETAAPEAPAEGEGEGATETETPAEPETPEAPAEGEGTEGAGTDTATSTGGVAEPLEAEAELEPLAASAAPRRVTARGPNPTRPRPTPARTDERMVLRASANVPGAAAGALLDTPKKVAQAFLRAISASAGYKGGRIDIPICSLGAWDASEVFGEERTLDDNARSNARKIEAISGPDALRASGGKCAPSPVLYDQPVLGTNARPVRDTMVHRYGADRGGVRTLPPPHLTDVGGAITVWTEANDQSPSSPATKACLTLTCPNEEEDVVDAIVQCLKIGNYRARNFPEQITAWMAKVAQLAARTSETKMLTEIGAGSTQVTVQTVLGTARDVLTTLDRATAQIRNRHRLDPDFPLRFGAPAWLLDNMITDLSREHPGATAERLATSDAEINAFITAKGINPSWFLDGETGQIYGAQHDGALLGWASHVVAYLYPEGQWLGLDGGGIDFGITRDSILNATNDFIIMSEIFEKTHQIRLADSYRLDIDICPDGTTTAAKSISVCAGGS